MPLPTPNADSIAYHVLKDVEHIDGTNDLWLAQATRAVKNPGLGDYMLVLIGPNKLYFRDGAAYAAKPGDTRRLRGYVKDWPQHGFKIEAHSPIEDPLYRFERQHRATLFASDYATARRLLIVLAKELVYDRP